jgi:1-deoxy-D-xylulose-5-phosphate synthase
VVFAIDRGGIVGEDGPTHQGLFDLSYLRGLPNMVLMAPKDEQELCHMLATAIKHDGPIALRYPRGIGVGVDIDNPYHSIPIGKGEVIENGKDVLILAIGRMVSEAVKARSDLKDQGISATVVNCRFVKPLDVDLICSLAQEIPRIITTEENVLEGGFGSAVLECLNDQKINSFEIKRLGISNTFVEHGSQALLRSKYGVDAKAIVKAAMTLTQKEKIFSNL